PLAEGRMIWHFNHRLNSMEFAADGGKRKSISNETSILEYNNPFFSIKPNYWVEKKDFKNRILEGYSNNWFLVYRGITGSTNERTYIASIMPIGPISNSLITIYSKKNPRDICYLLANFNSMIFDYIVRQKLSTNYLNYFIVEQFAILTPEKYNNKIKKEIFKNVLELTYTAYDLEDFARDCGYKGEPFGWDSKRRAILQAELDAIYAHLYKINKNDLEYILSTFPVLKRKEIEKFGEFQTKRLVLEAYNKYAKNIEMFE
ncbi:MAG: Eco57I restriction-modification methylase domain-containing protein, partial [Promethearchaeota archaeon]